MKLQARNSLLKHESGGWAAFARLGSLFAMLVALTSGVSVCDAGDHPNTRKGWLVGFGIGGGSAGLTSGGVSSDREGGGAGFFRAGYAFNEDLSLELDADVWTKEDQGVTLTFGASTVALNFYPGHSGFVLRGGIGSGSVDASAESGGVTVSASESGLGFLVGTGYEFRVLRTFAIGPQVDFGFASLDDFDANWVNVHLGFNWYFIPK